MAARRQFHIIFVKENHGVGASVSTNFDGEIKYEGKETHLNAP
jgi:hypothetical protein